MQDVFNAQSTPEDWILNTGKLITTAQGLGQFSQKAAEGIPAMLR